MGLRRLFRNIKNLTRYEIKEISEQQLSIIDFPYMLEGMKYEIEADLRVLPRFDIKNREDTIDILSNSEASLCRFGDGEISIMNDSTIAFQEPNPALAERLKEVLASNDDNIMIGVPNIYVPRSIVDSNDWITNSRRIFWGKYANGMCKLMHKEKKYYCAEITFTHVNTFGKNPDDSYYENNFNKFRKIWEKKKLVVICGERLFSKIKHNVYDNAKSIKYIYAPTENAFDRYDEIMENAKKEDKDTIIVVMLGPTATVLAYDLAKLGYRALDMGHLAKDYESFKTKPIMDKEYIQSFFGKD